MLIPRITKADNSIVKQMYSEWYILVAVTSEFMYWNIHQQVVYENDQIEKKVMYEKMEELKRDPLWWKKIEEQAFLLLTPTQQRSESMRVHKDAKVRDIISKL